MQPIRLVKGAGNGVDTACLMTASNMILGQGHKGDNNSCVCPLLQRFIIQTNDAMPDDLRCELYTPLIFEILGTRTDDKEVLKQRAYVFADWAVREIAPIRLEARGFKQQAEKLRALPVVCDYESAINAKKSAAASADASAYAAAAASAAADASAYAAAAASAAAYASADADAAAYAAAAASAAAYAAAAASAAAYASASAVKEIIWRKCPEIIRRVIAIGERKSVECVITMDELREKLGTKCAV